MPASLLRALYAESRGNIALAVDVAGLDVDPTRPARIVQGDYSAKPFATPQAAFDALPKRMQHALIVNIGAGTFPGFVVSGFDFLNVSPQITGTRATFTPATGPSSGTATVGPPPGGLSGQLVLTGAGWTPDDLAGKFLNVIAGASAGYVVPIKSNTSDTINLAYPIWIMSDSQFVIEDVVTVFNTNPGGSWYDIVTFSDNTGINYPTVRNLKATGAPSPYSGGFVAFGCSVDFRTCVADTTPYGFFAVTAMYGLASYCVTINTTYYAFFYSGNRGSYVTGSLARNCGFTGLLVQDGLGSFDAFHGINCTTGMEINDANFDGNFLNLDGGSTGVKVVNARLSMAHTYVANMTVKTFDLDACSLVRRTGWWSGLGNAGWGMDVSGVGNSFVDKSAAPFTAPTLAGTLGEVTVDGVNALLWTDLDALGDYAVDESTGARIVKR